MNPPPLSAVRPIEISEDIRERGQTLKVFGVEYRHVVLPNGDDLYVTEYGMPYFGNLLPEASYGDREWFDAHSIRLSRLGPKAAATSCSYKVRTKPWRGRSIDIVLKWNRMGQDIPGSWDNENLWNAEFNSPYEEFALLLEMRDTVYESPGRIRTHKPFAIFVPHRQVDMDRLGRKEHKMQQKLKNHGDIDLDMLRPYAVIYEWIKGIDASEAAHAGLLTEDAMIALTQWANVEMKRKGFQVTDSKPHHIIVRPADGQGVLKDRNGAVAYALIDFELLQRTPDRDTAVKSARRYAYLQEQSHRFDADLSIPLPAHLKAVSIMGVDYIYGPAESTGGSLWVVGRDPRLFDYFLPERWRQTPRRPLSVSDPVYHTTSKDNIQLVWKVSRVGTRPGISLSRPGENGSREHGYNSPFEEVALSVALDLKGVPTTYARAIYMAGQERASAVDESLFDPYQDLLTPEGTPVLRKDREYITIWGYWNKPDVMLAREDRDYYRAVDALRAFEEGILDAATYASLMDGTRARLLGCGIEDLNLCGNHILISVDINGSIVRDSGGFPEARICNFELLRTRAFPPQAGVRRTVVGLPG